VSIFPDPNQLESIAPAEILQALAQGRLAPDHRALRALVARPDETVSAMLAFAEQNRADDIVDLEPEFIALIRHMHNARSIPVLVDLLRRNPSEVTDGLIEAIVSFGAEAVDPLLGLHLEIQEKDEESAEEVAFVLANLGVKDARILDVLNQYLEFDALEGAFLLGLYGDPAAVQALEKLLAELPADDAPLRKELTGAIAQLRAGITPEREPDEFDLFDEYPETEPLPVELLTENERIELLENPLPEVRAKAVESFFNHESAPEVKQKLLELAKSDTAVEVRARAWETLMDAADNPQVVEAMLAVIRNPAAPAEERAGAVIGLALEADRNEVRQAMLDLYGLETARAKALQAMWRSLHPSFRDYFPKHLSDADLETRRAAIWGVGYYAIRSELDRLRGFFDDEELRADALFAYAMTIPGDVSPSRMKALLNRIEKDAHGLTEEEESLVMVAIDERLALGGKQPYFAGRSD
jgi:HEAT repeat protein